MRTLCHKCQKRLSIKGEKYCYNCRSDVIYKMRRDGYFEEMPRKTRGMETPLPIDRNKHAYLAAT